MISLDISTVLLGFAGAAVYLLAGLFTSVRAFDRHPFDLWIEYRGLTAQFLILALWPLAVPVCLFLAWRWWRSA